MTAIKAALAKTRNSAPGSDGICWRLLKSVNTTPVGEAVLQGIGMMAKVERGYFGQKEWRDIKMVMIPKPERTDQRSTDGGRPIVLANTVGKWGKNSSVHP